MNDKIREVALRVAEEFGYSTNSAMRNNFLPEFLTRCLQELSKDVEPVAWCAINHEYEAILRWDRDDQLGWKPLYSAPPLTEQDKLDAERWRAYQKRKQDLLDRGFLRNPLRDETIDRAMENGK